MLIPVSTQRLKEVTAGKGTVTVPQRIKFIEFFKELSYNVAWNIYRSEISSGTFTSESKYDDHIRNQLLDSRDVRNFIIVELILERMFNNPVFMASRCKYGKFHVPDTTLISNNIEDSAALFLDIDSILDHNWSLYSNSKVTNLSDIFKWVFLPTSTRKFKTLSEMMNNLTPIYKEFFESVFHHARELVLDEPIIPNFDWADMDTIFLTTDEYRAYFGEKAFDPVVVYKGKVVYCAIKEVNEAGISLRKETLDNFGLSVPLNTPTAIIIHDSSITGEPEQKCIILSVQVEETRGSHSWIRYITAETEGYNFVIDNHLADFTFKEAWSKVQQYQ